MHIPPSVLRRKAGYWVGQGVLAESGDSLILIENEGNRAALTDNDQYEEEQDSFMASTSSQKDEELQVIMFT